SGLAVTGGSTHSFNTFYWVNGPLARQLGIESGQGLIAAQANQAIGRTMSLIERNIAGFRAKETQMGTFGKLQSWVLAEDEEALKKIDWQPDHVAGGFDKDVSTVSAASSTFMGQNTIPSTSNPKILMQLLAYGITFRRVLFRSMINSPRTLLITPTTAEVLAKGGYTKKKLVDDLVETARKPTYEWTFSKVYGSYGRVFGSFDRELQRELNDPRAAKGKLPPWYPRAPGWEEIKTTPSIARNGIRVLVCVDPSRNKAQVLAGGRGRSVKEVKPGAAGGCEVVMEPGMPHQPAVNQRGLMRAGVVDDEVDVQVRRDRGVDRHQEASKFSGAVALMELADNFATLGVQRGEERGRPMPRVVVGPALDLPRPHRQHGLRAIERLDLGFFVDAQHQRFVRRIEVEPDEVADFVDEQWIFGQLEGLAPRRLQPERAPDAAHR